MDGLLGSNGIARAQNGTVYVASSVFGQITVLEEQYDRSLVLGDIIALGAFSSSVISFLKPFFGCHRSSRGQPLHRYKRGIMGSGNSRWISLHLCVS